MTWPLPRMMRGSEAGASGAGLASAAAGGVCCTLLGFTAPLGGLDGACDVVSTATAAGIDGCVA